MTEHLSCGCPLGWPHRCRQFADYKADRLAQAADEAREAYDEYLQNRSELRLIKDEHRDREFWKVAEIADFLRVSEMTVHRLRERGELKAITIGRSIRIPTQSLDDYLERKAREA